MRSARETFFYSTVQSPVGTLTLVLSETGVVRLEFGETALQGKSDYVLSQERTAACAAELGEYFAGMRKKFDVPLDLRGTPFQRQCWGALLDIPYGETRSYAEIAAKVGRPNAFRAVGMANHANPVAIMVPCHRVIGTNGELTGYGGGLDTKRMLLALERRHCGL
jgi:O-6-methylguanine DNA methyltransferase